MNHRPNHPPRLHSPRVSSSPIAPFRAPSPRGSRGRTARGRTAAALIAAALTAALPTRVAHGQAAPPAGAGGAAGATATAPAVPPAPLPTSVNPLKAATAITPSGSSVIAAFVNGQFAVLTAPGTGGAKSAREALETGAAAAPGVPPVPTSPAYQAAYAAAVAAAAGRAASNPSVLVRVNLATAVYRVATQMPHPGLLPVVRSLLGDKEPAVQIPALKAARLLYPALLTSNPPQADALADAIVTAVRLHGTSGDESAEPIAEEAFLALSGAPVTGAAANPAGLSKSAIPNLLKLLQARVQLLQAAQPGQVDSLPPRPDLERGPLVVLSVGQRGKLSAAQQALAGRAMFDLASEAARLAPLTPPPQAGSTGVNQTDLVGLARDALGGIQVMAGNGTPLATDAVTASKLAVPNPNPALLTPAVDALKPQMAAAGLLGNWPTAPAPAPAPPPAPKPPAPKPAAVAPQPPAVTPRPAAAPAGTATRPATAPRPNTGTPARPAATPAAARAAGTGAASLYK